MNTRRFLNRAGLLALGIFFLLSHLLFLGCHLTGPKPDIVSDEKSPDRRYSNAEVRQMTVDQPFLVSGDYFRSRTAADQSEAGQQETDRSPKTDTVQKQGQVKDSKAPSKAPSKATIDQQSRPYGLKIGMIWDAPRFSGQIANQVRRAVQDAVSQNLILVNKEGLRDGLVRPECLDNLDMSCIARQVAVYPGVRLLVLIDSFDLPDTFPGRAAIKVRLMDAGLGHRYPARKITESLSEKSAISGFLRQAFERVFASTREKATAMPAHCRVFDVKKDRYYISAGRLTGVAPGDTYAVAAGGETVTSPAGAPVGWVPDKKKATVRVEMLVGRDAAACSLVNGKPPVPGEFVLFDSSEALD